MKEKRSYQQYPQAFKEEAVALVIDQGYSAQQAADSLGIRPNMIYRWKQQLDQQQGNKSLSGKERLELNRLGERPSYLQNFGGVMVGATQSFTVH